MPTAKKDSPHPQPRFHYAWIILTVGTLVVFGSLGLARFGYTMLLPAMQNGLGLDNTRAGGLATANLAGYLILSVAGGALAVRFGPRAVITAGLTLAAISMMMTGLSESFTGALADATGSLSPAMLLAAGAAFLGALGCLLLRHPGLTRTKHHKIPNTSNRAIELSDRSEGLDER